MTAATKGKGKGRKAKGNAAEPSRTLDEIALHEFASTGEVSGLLVLADWLEENIGQTMYPLAAELRSVGLGTVSACAVKFFMNSAALVRGTSLHKLSNWFMGAVEYAKAEAWYEENRAGDAGGHEVGALNIRWEEDPDYSPDDYDAPDRPGTGWSCYVQSWDGYGWYTDAGLHAITFGGPTTPDGTPHKRVVEAELLSEVKATWEGFEK